MLLSAAAYQRAPTTEARTALIAAGKQPLDLFVTVGTSDVTALAYSADGKDLATGDADGHITMWDTATWRHVGLRLSSGNSQITALAFSPDQDYLVAGDEAGHSGVWDTQTGKAQISAGNASNSIKCLAFSADGKFFAAGFSSGTVLLSNLVTGHDLTLSEGYQIAQARQQPRVQPGRADPSRWQHHWRRSIVGHGDRPPVRKSSVTENESTEVASLAFSLDGKTLAVARYSDLIRLWSISTASETASLAEDSPVQSIAYSPAGNTLAAGTSDGTVGLWNINSRTQTATFGEGSAVTTVTYDPNGNILAAADTSGHVGLWNTTLGSQASTFSEGDGSPVTNVAFSPDGQTLAAGDLAGNVDMWSVSEPPPPRRR